ncbi:HlyD family type I secretion periplasmic adaptor subunit [Parvularcula oceani]|uniref:HlyD family type I secretion periplasmic adaptor subunit n=1 Tax=Parvularcula oceani TaxID=1247963 RepID=UPI0004E13ABF|nr:HlyD family type I secretion periplasmic adaptor subunit [Parvularcula oceani]
MRSGDRLSPLSDRSVRWSALACAVGFGGFLLWAGIAPLEEGVTASGQIVVEDDRKAVEHYEGGIIRALYVGEGDMVEAGEVLLELEPLQSEAARDELAQELAVQTATLERLTALRAGRDSASFEALEGIPVEAAVREDIRARQQALFDQQRAARDAELEVLTSRRASLEGRADDLRGQIQATEAALASAREDLALRREMLAERLETIGNVQRLQREVSGLESDLARLTGSRNEALAGIRQAEDEITQARARLAEETGREIVQAQAGALAARERLRGTEDRLARTVIRAPISGAVLNLDVSTIGGVVRQGEPIMEIVPSSAELIASVRLSPTDRDAVSPGQAVEAQLTAYKSFIAPRLPGQVIGVSADLVEDPATRTYYYEARLALDAEELDPEARIEIIPGMPVDAFIASGRSRTLLDYVFEPVSATLSRGSRMN